MRPRFPSGSVRDAGRIAAVVLGWLLASAAFVNADRGLDSLGPPPPSAAAPFLEARDESTAVVVSRVYAHSARDNEFVELANRGLEAVDLSGWSLTDGEAIATFPSDVELPPESRIVVTRNSTSYAEDLLTPADFTWDRGDARRMEGGVLRLADDGDEVLLTNPAAEVVDAVVYGESGYVGVGWDGVPARKMKRGEVAIRRTDDRGAFVDRGDATDWDGPRSHRLGQSAFELDASASTGPATAIVSPDHGDGPLLAFLESAIMSIDLGLYTLTSDRIASVLADAASRGVSVRILLEGAPVGGIEREGQRIVGGLLAAGAQVRFLSGGDDVVKRYRYLHAKYAIVDGTSAWIGSENFGEAGFPPYGNPGNRGWSVVMEDPPVARSLRSVFVADFDPRRRDSRAAEEPPGVLDSPPPIARWLSPKPTPPRDVRLVIGPDMSLDPAGLLGVLATAEERIWVEAFYLEAAWDGGPNPFLEAVFEAARRGVSVRLLLDGSWWSTPDEEDGNDERVSELNERARELGVDFEARLLEPRGRIERLHNKGLVVDGRVVFVSSMNWAETSATENREVGVLLEDPALAAIFEAAFGEDWGDAPGTRGWLDEPVSLILFYAFVAAASAASLRKLRASRKGIKPGSRVKARGLARSDLRSRSREVRLLPAELVVEPGPRARGGGRSRRRRAEARDRERGLEGH